MLSAESSIASPKHGVTEGRRGDFLKQTLDPAAPFPSSPDQRCVWSVNHENLPKVICSFFDDTDSGVKSRLQRLKAPLSCGGSVLPSSAGDASKAAWSDEGAGKQCQGPVPSPAAALHKGPAGSGLIYSTFTSPT